MSYWTHIVGVIDFDTFKESVALAEDILKELESAPKITGSEKDAEIFVNQLSGHNVSVGRDCKRCKYKDTGDDEYCYTPEDFECPSGEYQTRVVITVIGDLRDRGKKTTETEWKEFVAYIENNMSGYIRNISCNILSD